MRGDLKLADYVSAYWVIGDLGARLLRYYRQLEEVQSKASIGSCVCGGGSLADVCSVGI